MLVQGHNLRLLDEAREVGHQQHPGPVTRTVGTCLINPGGLSLVKRAKLIPIARIPAIPKSAVNNRTRMAMRDFGGHMRVRLH